MPARANYKIEVDVPSMLVIRDLGPWHKYSTITNDAEAVVEELAPRLHDRPLLYFDSEGELNRLLVRDGQFIGFALGP